jgi:hypothetical protein
VNAIAKFQNEFEAIRSSVSIGGANLSFERRSVALNLSLESNVSESICNSLPATGRLNPATLIAIYISLHLRVAQMTDSPLELVYDYNRVSALVKSVQEKNGLYPSGALDEMTVSKL